MTRVQFDLETIEGGRLTTRSATVDVPPGSSLRRVRLSVAGLVLLSVPLSPWEYLGDDDDQDDDE